MTELEQSKPKGGCLRWIGRVLLTLILLLVVLGIIGTIYQNQAEQAFLEENPPFGDLINIGDRTLHLHCEGEGNPTVILDAGQGGWSIDYVDIQAELATQTTVCAYDRAGYGWSDPANDNRTVEDISRDLNLMLSAAEIDEPVVLVAFSFSGLSARYHVEQYPDDVVGLVLVDPAHEQDREIQPDDLLAAQQSLIGAYSAFEAAANIGLVRILEPAEIAPYAPFIATDPVSPNLYYAALSNPSWWATSRKEFATNLFGELPQLPNSLTIPTRIIGLTNSIPDEAYDQINQDRLAVLQSLADSSDSAELVIYDDIAHGEIILETDLVVNAIEDVINEITQD